MTRIVGKLVTVSVVLAAAAATSSLALNQTGLSGYWKGIVDTGAMPMEFSVQLTQAEDGSWKGEIDIPSQGIRNLRLDLVSVEGATVSLGVTGIIGGPVFTGGTSEDGQAISGMLSQAGRDFPFTLQRSAEPPEDYSHIYDEYDKAGTPGTGLQGEWLGIIEARPARLRVILRISAAPDGDLTATLDMPDQKAGELYADDISLEGTSVSFSLAHLMASYHGEMSEDGSTVTGTWQQGQRDFPLNFRRQPTGER
jgi:hypothetical protein